VGFIVFLRTFLASLLFVVALLVVEDCGAVGGVPMFAVVLRTSGGGGGGDVSDSGG
jgi:hypothetical protein